MAAPMSPDRGADSNEKRFAAIVRATAEELGFQVTEEVVLPTNPKVRVDLLLERDGRRIYVEIVGYGSKSAKRFYFDVGDGGSAEARYNIESGHWEGFYGSVRVQKNLQTHLREFLTTLLDS